MRISILVSAAFLLLGSCVSPQSTECPGGLVCPVGSVCAAKQEVCIKDSCGNGVVDPGEVCDDGNIITGDGCSANCKSAEGCGNGVLDTEKGEVCDDGNNVSGDGCSADCKSREGCGNGAVDPDKGEVCDDGNNLSGDGCSADCRSKEVCGNKIVDVNEACDDGNQLNGDGCSANCKSNEKCGNGILDLVTGEVCDDGNQLDLDGCSANCKSNEKCGNGYPDVPKGEVCDDGNNMDGDGCSADCRSGEMCLNRVIDVGEQCDDGMETALCNTNCTIAFCGDRILNIAHGETCDTGGESATCNFDCTGVNCGDRHVNTLAGEQCDDGNSNEHDNCLPVVCTRARCGDGKIWYGHERCDHNGVLGGSCSNDCQFSTLCGNGTIDVAAGERCDDSNRVSNDGCSFDCLSNETCGNGYVDVVKGEQCDDGNTTDDGNGCSANCMVNSRCGDGILDSAIGEVCDDGNRLSGDGCRADCVSDETCGNGIIDTARGETCDDGNLIDGDSCPRTCRSAFCGDGVTSPPEQCDDTNSSNLDACLNNCLNAFCGDGFVRTDIATEICDDGNMNANDGCSPSCTVETGFNCVTQPTGQSQCKAICGDGMILFGETCDDFNNSACGGCNATCTANQAPAPATGIISAVAGDQLRDGETFTISDGLNVRVFEFDIAAASPANGVAPGHVAVVVNGGAPAGVDTAGTVAGLISTAITNVGGAFNVSVTLVNGIQVSLANDFVGSSGNVLLGETVTNTGFTVSGMSGGRGADCPTGTGCRANSDCQSGRCDTTTTHACLTSSCSDGVKNGSETGTDCGGSCNTCPNSQGCLLALDCQSNFCNFGLCQACLMDGNCLPNQFCDLSLNGGTCVPDKATGQACTSASQCTSGNCADNFCCNLPCSGSCDVCSVAAGSAMNGTCTILGAGSAGSPSCSPALCNGSSASCPAACASDAGCTGNSYCAADGSCQPRKAQGAACNSAQGADCQVAGCRVCVASTSGCVDGFCCNTACTGGCNVCSVALGASSNGTCTVLGAGAAGSPSCSPTVCDGSSASCPAGCTSDSGCAATHYCAANSTCQPRKAQGSACNPAAGSDCLGAGCRVCDSSTAGCVDGFCCDSTCVGSCNACSVALGATTNGTCATVAAGNAGSPSCSPGVCNGTSINCPSGCTSDSECAGTSYCAANGTCQPRKSQGTACDPAAGADCLGAGCRVCAASTAGCVDGFCCDTTCTGSCNACSVALGATTNGTCANISAGSAGSPSCSPTVCSGLSSSCPAGCTSDSGCAATHFCNAAGTCQIRKTQGQSCNPTAGADCEVAGCRVCSGTTAGCFDGFCCDTTCTGGCNVCAVSLGASADGTCTILNAGAGGVPSCSPEVCDGSSALCPSGCTTDSGCASTHYCASGGTCQPRKAPGAACNSAAGADCQGAGCRVCDDPSVACVDGFCCNSACTGTCQACSAAKKGSGSNGVCGSIGVGLTDDAPVCSASNACNGSGSCLLANGQACTLGTQCASGTCDTVTTNTCVP